MRGGGLLACLVLLVVACSGTPTRIGSLPTATPDRTPVTVRVGHVASPLWAPLYVALDRGYFDKQNVTVQLQAIRTGQDPIDLVSRDQVDAVVTDFGSDMFDGLARGDKFKVTGSMAMLPADGTTPLVLEVARPLTQSGKVKTAADLKGRKIAIAGGAGSGSGYLADLVLKKAGIGLKDLTVVDLAAPDMETAIASTGIDVALVPAPYTTSIEQKNVAGPMGAPPPGSTWSGVLFGSRLSGSAGQRFLMALAQGARDLQGPARTADDTVAILSKYTGRPASELKSVPPFDWRPNLEPDVRSLDAMQATYRELGLLHYERDLPDSRYVDASYSKFAASAVHPAIR
ncbi:MAG TPA: ABC transporter substrate-binding protein [Candidatus Dormibacteraeota bacterium]|nr:ABC transporter substrate-binding protein [Candidatus Dormibacteraeota bacterium]